MSSSSEESQTLTIQRRGHPHATPEQRMDFCKWMFRDDIYTQIKGKPNYKQRDFLMKRYLNDFGVKIGESFLLGLEWARLTKNGDKLYLMEAPFTLEEYCKHPGVLFLKLSKKKNKKGTQEDSSSSSTE